MSKKYELVVDDTITFWGWKLFRIRALISFGSVDAGELGGYIQKEENLSQEDDAWVSGNAKVWGNAEVSGDAWVSGDAKVWGDAKVSGNAKVWGNAEVSGDAWVSGDAKVWGDAKVSDLEDVIVFKNHWSSGRHFTYTRSNKMWKVGCFYGTGQELIDKAYQDNDKSGSYYKAYVEFVEKLEALDELERP